MKTAVKALSVLLALIMFTLPLDILSFSQSSAPENLFTQTIDFGELPVSNSEFYNSGCKLNTESLLFTSGIMLDKADTVGMGRNKTNFKGFYTEDTDKDGKTDTLCAVSMNNWGMRFTFGMNVPSDWSGAEALVLHVDNSANSWNVMQSFNLKLNTPSKSIAMKPAADAAGEICYFINDTDESISTCTADDSGWPVMPGNKSGFIIIPLSVLEELPGGEVSSVSFDISSKASIFTRLSQIGFTDNITAMLGALSGGIPHTVSIEPSVGGSASVTVDGAVAGMAAEGQTVRIVPVPETGYELANVSAFSADGNTEIEVNGVLFTMPDFDVSVKVLFESASGSGYPERIYSTATDFSVLPSRDYRDGNPNWDCVINTDTDLYKKGIILDREPMGHGENTVNFHGFWAEDINADGKTDYLKAHPFDNTGMNFTLGFNSKKNIPENPEAVAVKIGNKDIAGSAWHEGLYQSMQLTLIDSKGKEYPMIDKAGKSVTFISADDQVRRDYQLSEYGYSFIPVGSTGWAVIPLDLFEGITGEEEFIGVGVSLSSTWNAYTYIYEFGFTNDMTELIKIMTGKAERYDITVSDCKNGRITADTVSSREGRRISIAAFPDDGYILDKLSVAETESGKLLTVTGGAFSMPPCDVTISADFKESPYNSAGRLNQVYKITQDFETAQHGEYIDWEKGPDLTPFVEQGIFIEDLKRGFRSEGVANSYNGNGIFVADNEEGFGTSLRLWTHDNLGMSVSIKSNELGDSIDYEGLVLHMHNTETRNSLMPSMTVVLYLKGADGKPDLSNPITVKSATSLYGTTVYLIDDETGEVTEKPLGFSAEQAGSLTETEKNQAQYFMPDAFTGYAVIPFSYFAGDFSAQEIAGIRINYNYTDWYMYSSIFDVGFTPSIANFVRISSLGNYSEVLLYDELYNIDQSVFERYFDTENSLTVSVLKDYLNYYMWRFEGVDIVNKIALNPEIVFMNVNDSGIERLYSSDSAVYVNIKQNKFPAKAKISLDVSWDFFDGTHVCLYRYDAKSGRLTDMGIKGIVKQGFIELPFTEGGEYVIALERFTPGIAEREVETGTEEDVYDTVTKNNIVEEKNGHYETVQGTKRYKTVKTIHFDGLKTWFIAVIVSGAVVLAAGLTAITVVLIKKRKRSKT